MLRRAKGSWTGLAAALALALPSHAADLTKAPATLIVTAQEGTRAEITVDAAGRTGLAWLAETSVGSISAVSEPTPGRYVATLEIPPADMPRAALVVFSPQGSADVEPRWRVIPVGVRTTFSARTEPRSQVTASVGARSFGPVEAGRDGAFTLDVDLAPGSREAHVRLKDLAGNVTTTTVPVPRRHHDPLTVTLDRYRVASDGSATARVFAFTFDDAGRPAAGTVSATASAGEVGAFEQASPGLWVATYVPPKDGREGLADVTVTLRRGDRTDEELDRLALVRGLPGTLKLHADPVEIIAGTTRQVALTARVADAAGNPLPAQPVRFFADRGELSPGADRGDGSYSAVLTPPALVESGGIEVKAMLPVGGPARVPARLVVTANPETVPTSWRAFSLVTAVVTDAEGQPVPGEIVLFHVSRGDGTVTPAAITYDGGQAFADFSANPVEEIVSIDAISTSVPALRSSVSIRKKASGDFAILSRPAVLAQGGQGSVLLVLDEERRILQDAVMLTMVAGAPSRLVASADPTTLPADGTSQSQLQARLLDEAGNEVREQALSWAVDRGTVAGDSETDDGVHRSAFTAPEGRGSGRATVTVSHAGSGLSATLPLQLELGPPAQLVLSSDEAELPADGLSRATLTATLRDASGEPIPSAALRFSVSGGDAVVDPSATTGGSGEATASLLASLVPGPVTVEAATDGGLTATATIELLALRPERLDVTARPASIAADGLERSEILAVVEDGQGRRLEDEPLRFQVSGQAELTAERVRTNADGEARTWLSGSAAEIARVRVVSERAPGIEEEVEVELVAASLPAAIAPIVPACSTGVRLVAIAPQAVAFEWDWTGDGTADARGPDVVAALPAGPHEIVLRVADAAGLRGVARTSVTITQAPSAFIDPPPQRVASGSELQLDGSGSSGGTGPLQYSWDLDGDGSSDGDQPTVDWRAPDGLRTAILTVTDDAGCSGTDDVEVLFGDPPDLATTVSPPGTGTFAPGSIAAFGVGWENLGPGAAAGAQVVITLDGPAAFVPASLPAGSVPVSATEVRVPLNAPPAGTSGSFGVQVLLGQDFAGASQAVTLTSRITCPLGDADPTNDTDAATVLVERSVDLAVTLSASAAGPLPAGAPLDLVVIVRNLSASDAPGVVADLAWDAALYDGSAGALSVPAPAGLTLDVGLVASGATVSIPVTGAVRAVLPEPAQDLVLTADAYFPGGDVNPADNTARLSLALVAAPDLAVTIVARPARSPVFPGDAIAYEAAWSNQGSTAASDVTLTSVMSAGTLAGLDANPSGGVLTGDTLTFTLGSVPAGASGSATWTARLAQALPAGLASACNDVTIRESAGLDPRPGNDTATACVPIDDRPVLAVTISAPPAAASGDAVTYAVTVTNTGASASGVDVELRLSGALASSGAASGDPLVLRTSLGRVDRGAPRTWRPQVVLACPQAAPDPLLQATAEIVLGGIASGITASHGIAVAARPDVVATLQLPAAGNAGDTLPGTLTLGNVGCAPCAAAGGSVTWSATLAGGAQPLIFPAGVLAAGFAIDLPFSIAANATLPAVTNAMTVSVLATCGGDVNPANDSDTVAVALGAAPDVEITAVDFPAALAAGETGAVVVHLLNTGTTDARPVSVSLTPADAALFSSVAPPAVVLASIAPGAPADAAFTVTAAAMLPRSSQGTSLRTDVSYADDADPGNDTRVLPVTLTAAPDLAVTVQLTGTSAPPLPGSVVTALATVTNQGTTASVGGVLELLRDPALLLRIDPADSGALATRALPAIIPGGSTPVRFSFSLVNPLPAGAALTSVTATAVDALDPNPADNQASASLPLGDVVDLTADVTLAPGSAPLPASGDLGVTVKVGNDGGRQANGVDAVATWDPALVASVDASRIPGAVLTAGRLLIPVGMLLENDPGKTFDFSLRLAAVLPSTVNPLCVTVTLVSDAIANPENDLADNSDSSCADATAAADLCTTVTALPVPASPAPGDALGYDVVVENRGTTGASSVAVTLTTDPWLLLPATTSAGGAAAIGSVAWNAGALAAGASRTFTAGYAIPAFAGGETSRIVEATAAATAPEDDPASGCASSGNRVSTSITTGPDLQVILRLAATTEDPPRRGSRLTYEIAVTNVGNSQSQPGSLDFTLPPETSLVSSSLGGTPAAGGVSWSVARLQPDIGVIYQVVVEVGAALPPGVYVLHSEAAASSPQDDNASNDAAIHDLAMNLDVDLAILDFRCVADPAPAYPGSSLACSGSVRNDGSYPASNSRLLVDVGALALLQTTGTRTTTIALLPGGSARPLQPRESVAFSFRARSLAVLPQQDNAVTLAVQASCDQPDADPADDTASQSLTVRAWTDLHAEITAVDVNDAPLVAGDRIDLSLSLSNAGGTMPAAPVLVTATYDPAICDPGPGGDLTGAGGALTATLPAPLAPTDPPVILRWSLVVRPVLPGPSTLFTPCAGGAAPAERSPNDDDACAPPFTILAWPDLVVSLTPTPPRNPAAPGDEIAYAATIENRGTTAATGVVLVDDRREDLTTGLVPGSATPAATDTGTDIRFDLGTIPAGAPPVNATWKVKLAPSMPAADTSVPTTACATAAEIDRAAADNCASASVPVRAPVDAQVVLQASAPSGGCAPGAIITLTLAVSNTGLAPAPGTQVTLTLPPELTVLSAPGSVPGSVPLRFDLGTLAPAGAPVSLQVMARVSRTLPDASFPLACTAAVTHGAAFAEADPADDSSTVTLPCRAWADVVPMIVRTSAAPLPGQPVTYALRCRNEGSTTARGVTITLAENPALVTPAGADPGALGRTYVVGDIGPELASDIVNLGYAVRPVVPDATNVLTITATAATTTPQQDLADDVAQATDTFLAQADLWSEITLAPPAVPSRPRDEVVATITWGNSGETASVATLTIMLDPNVTYVSSSGTPVVSGQSLAFALGSVAPGASGSLTVRFRINAVMPSPASDVLATSLVEGSVPDQDASNDADLASVLVSAAPDLAVTLRFTSPVPATVAASGTLEGELVITNPGETRATSAGATLAPREAGIIGAASCVGDPQCSASGSALTWTLGRIEAGAAPLVKRFRFTAAATLPAVTNTLTAEGRAFCNESELDAANNTATSTATITGRPDLKLVSMVPSRTVVADGSLFTVDYAYSNVGTAPADPAELAVSFDSQLIRPVFSTGGTVSVDEITFDWGAPLRPDGTTATERAQYFVYSAPPPPNTRVIGMQAVARERLPVGTSRDANPADNSGSISLNACYINVRASFAAAQTQPCMGSGITMVADATPSTGVTYSWWVEGGLGTFTSTTSRTTTYFAPVTATSQTYRVHVTVADAADPSCFDEAVLSVIPLTSCASCGCSWTNFNVQYDSAFTRLDRYGDQTALQGETVGFRVQLRQTQNVRSGWLLGGPGNSKLTVSDGTSTYSAYLSGDIWIECNQVYIAEFGPAVMPATMTIGFQPIRFEFVTRDECGHPVQRDWDNNTGDRVQILAAPSGNSGIEFTDWGPSTPGTPGR